MSRSPEDFFEDGSFEELQSLFSDDRYFAELGKYVTLIHGFEDTILSMEKTHPHTFYSPLNNMSMSIH